METNNDRVTIVMVPYEQYSAFPKAIDALYRYTKHPFDLIIIEGNAPDFIRSVLEKREKYHGNIRIIYTNHQPLAGEARNLALPYLRNPFAFFMDNDVCVTAGWLANLVRCLKETGAEIVYPSILNTQNPTYILNSGNALQENMDINVHGFLITKKALEHIDGFDENTSSFILGLDLGLKAKAKNIEVHKDAKTCLKRDFAFSGKTQDIRLFHRQWDAEYHQRSLAYLKQKWAIELDERKYMDWLTNKGQDLIQSAKSYSAKGAKERLQSRMNFARIGFKRLLHTFISL